MSDTPVTHSELDDRLIALRAEAVALIEASEQKTTGLIDAAEQRLARQQINLVAQIRGSMDRNFDDIQAHGRQIEKLNSNVVRALEGYDLLKGQISDGFNDVKEDGRKRTEELRTEVRVQGLAIQRWQRMERGAITVIGLLVPAYKWVRQSLGWLFNFVPLLLSLGGGILLGVALFFVGMQ